MVSFSWTEAEPEMEVTLSMTPFSLPTVPLNSSTRASIVVCICPPKLCHRVRVTGCFGSNPDGSLHPDNRVTMINTTQKIPPNSKQVWRDKIAI